MVPNKSLAMRFLLLRRFMVQRLSQTLLVLMALSVGSALISAMSGVYFDIHSKMSQEVRTFGANLFVGPKRDDIMTQAQYDAFIEALPAQDVVAQSPHLYGLIDTDQGSLVAMGVRVSELQQLVPYWKVEGRWLRLDFDDRHIMIGRSLAQRLHLNVGDALNMTLGQKSYPVTVRGILESGDEVDHYVVMSLSLARTLLQAPLRVHLGHVSLANDQQQVIAATQMAQARFPQLEVHPILQISDSEGVLLDTMKGLMGIIAVFILLLSTLCVNTTLTAMMTERRKEFALQKALGASRRDLMQQILLETALFGTLASVIGLLLGYLIAQVLGQAVFHAAIDFRLQVLPMTVGVSYIAAFAAVVLPMRQTLSVAPAQVLKGES